MGAKPEVPIATTAARKINSRGFWLQRPTLHLRDGERAVRLAQRVLQISGQRKAVVFQTLAAAYAETGRFSAAIDTAKRGLQLATEQNNAGLVDDLKKNISLFESNVPVRDDTLRN